MRSKTINLLQYLWVHGASSTVPSLAVQVILLSKLEHDDVVLREAVIRALTMCLQRSAHSAQQRSDSEIVKVSVIFAEGHLFYSHASLGSFINADCLC